jgi:adenylosuccinate lyase
MAVLVYLLYLHKIVHNKNVIVMVVISPSELSGNLNKYLRIAQTEKVIIQRQEETYELVKKDCLIAADELETALTGAQLKERMHGHIDNLFSV